jgi:hypothetical protein
MRRACVILAALAFAACKVDVEGAGCVTPGSRAECPDGQACGNDLRCSIRAASCAARCDLGPTRCIDGATLETCIPDLDPVCGTLRPQACATNLACVDRPTSHACECAANLTAVFAAGTGGSSLGGPWYPTGLPDPPQCRFKKLGDALDAAVAYGGTTTVQAFGGGSGGPVMFTSETFPLVVPADVTIFGADSPAGETIIQGDAATPATMVTLQGTLERVHLQNVSMTGNGVDMTCGATGSPTLRDVVVSAGAQKLAKGVTVSGPCGAILERVDASGASAAALDIAVPATPIVIVSGCWLHGCGAGIQASGGKVGIFADSTTGALTQVTDNTGAGIVLSGTTATEASLASVLVARNGGTGIYINQIPIASKLTMVSCDVHSNGTATPQTYGPSPQRVAGGILLTQSSLATFSLQSNRIYANDGNMGADELAFYSSGAWSVNNSACGSANTFGCTGGGVVVGTPAAVSITAGTVDARTSRWSVVPPPLSGTVTWSPECPGTPPACPP